MELEVIEERENPFFNRREIRLNIRHENAPTPSKSELLKELASRYSVPEDLIAIDYIFTKKGVGQSLAKVKIYKEKPKEKSKKEEKPKEGEKGEKNEAQVDEGK